MIDSGALNGQVYPFYTGRVDAEKNIFTTIVGRNGSGKSRLLRNVVSEAIECYVNKNVSLSKGLEFVSPKSYPFNVIAVSTSPFDRFPMTEFGGIASKSDLAPGYYFYQGLRGLYSTNLSMSFMARVLGDLVQALSQGDNRLATVLDVLDYLGYHRRMEVRFISNVSISTLVKLINSENPLRVLDSLANGSKEPKIGFDFRKVTQRLHGAPEGLRKKFLGALSSFLENHAVNKLELVISREGVFDTHTNTSLKTDFSVLLECGLFRPRDIRLQKKDIDKPFRISDASSGEQCVVMAMLGIASRIADGSLICIDEPEICLHPEWQERYIEVLMSTFSGFKGCHFIIATHSPQIISHLEDENCYIVDLQTKKVLEARDVANRSADFQLAEIFRAPGFKNEYLMRELVSALSSLSLGKKLSKDKLTLLDSFVALKSLLKNDDPVLQLIVLFEAARSGAVHD
ncbi:ATP-binding protein [Pseudomonas sp. JDS28PS106]|uniref:ATP-binding protein n=1 Tax=Pseudomonas sp. JDS28PS106 TaxID=2497235 RepID=UPI002FCF5C36